MPKNTKPSSIAYSKKASLPMKITTWTGMVMKKYSLQVQRLVIQFFSQKKLHQRVTSGLKLLNQAVYNASVLGHSMSPSLCWKVEPTLVSSESQVHPLIYMTLSKKYDCTKSMHSQGDLWCKWSVSDDFQTQMIDRGAMCRDMHNMDHTKVRVIHGIDRYHSLFIWISYIFKLNDKKLTKK